MKDNNDGTPKTGRMGSSMGDCARNRGHWKVEAPEGSVIPDPLLGDETGVSCILALG